MQRERLSTIIKRRGSRESERRHTCSQQWAKLVLIRRMNDLAGERGRRLFCPIPPSASRLVQTTEDHLQPLQSSPSQACFLLSVFDLPHSSLVMLLGCKREHVRTTQEPPRACMFFFTLPDQSYGQPPAVSLTSALPLVSTLAQAKRASIFHTAAGPDSRSHSEL